MVCTTVTVIAPSPVVTVVPDTTSFADPSGNPLITCSRPVGEYINIVAQIQVSNAPAKFNLKVDYTKDGVAQTYTTTQMTQGIGTTNQWISLAVVYVAGTYASLTMSVINVVPA